MRVSDEPMLPKATRQEQRMPDETDMVTHICQPEQEAGDAMATEGR
jgi:hypothetical protein